MAVKSKIKPKSKVKAAVKIKATVKKGALKVSTTRKTSSSSASKVKAISKNAKPVAKNALHAERKKTKPAEAPVEVTRTVNLASQIRQPVKPVMRKSSASVGVANANLFKFMKAPRPEYAFEVGDTVEVFCDHEKGRERVRGWIKGIVVQVDNKMVAVQFRSNVFLTDGWMVPDRILWYPLNSEHIRPVTTGKKPLFKKDIIPDY
ncbi:MAG: hypothetical protein IPG80_17090 [Anaerolineales bacterium]|jgi:hypothetical protein|uniref:hypothetical protein n=1 Tax=Candidatus Villigracilis vicinus TaxID=3140679 RepID=UPI00313751E6|nr:hypothetical protein [Anaerolineales bacterium]MBK9782455.1 hypothetical protein [Anaerolineales bacterium]